MNITAKVEWLAGSDKALAEVGSKATQKNVLRRTLLKAAKGIDDAASALAPVETGKLQISVITGTRLTRSQRSTAYKAGALGVVEVHIGTALSRGMFQEFGTVKMLPQPFMRPAWDNEKQRSLNTIKEELWIEIRKAAERAAKRRAKAGL